MKMPELRNLQLDGFAPYRLSLASTLVSEVIARAYRSLFGLTIAEWRVIAILAHHARATQAEVAAATRMDKLTVSRAAIELDARSLVTRVSHPDDKRSRILFLSESGWELYAQVAPKALKLEDELLKEFDTGEKELLLSMLRRVEASAARMIETALRA